MVKINSFSTIEIWSADYVNKVYTRREEDTDAEIVQIERANHNGTMFIVEVIRNKDKVTIHDSGFMENIMLCGEKNENKKYMQVL